MTDNTIGGEVDEILRSLDIEAMHWKNGTTSLQLNEQSVVKTRQAIVNLIAQEANKAVIAELKFEQRYFTKFPFQEFIDKYVADRIKALTADKEQA